MINFGLDLVVLGLGVGIVVMTGGVGAVGVVAGIQLATGGLLAINDGARAVSDFADHGAIGHFEDNDPRFSPYFKAATIAAIGVQLVDGDGLADYLRSYGPTAVATTERARLFDIFSPAREWRETKAALGESNISLKDALRGDIGPGQRVRLGKMLEVGGRKAKISTIRRILALKVANDFGASLLTLGQAFVGGPMDGAFDAVSNFQFSLLFVNDNNQIRVLPYHSVPPGNGSWNPQDKANAYPRTGPHQIP